MRLNKPCNRMKRIPQNIIKFCKRISLSLGLLSLVANAQIYKSTDENGVVTFSDVPPTAGSGVKSTVAVSYTHLTLPTILLV